MTFVSTGSLPPPDAVQAALDEAYERHGTTPTARSRASTRRSRGCPPTCSASASSAPAGRVFAAGDADHEFTIMSVSKPFVFALVVRAARAGRARAPAVGVNATGQPFNSVEAVERSADGRTNPMVNSGAIATTSLIPASWDAVPARRAGALRRPRTGDATRRSTPPRSATNTRNRELARLLRPRARLPRSVEAVDLYTRQCSLRVSAHDLAVMGATLADGGVNPVTGERVIAAEVCHYTLAVMLTAGLYETSGDWLYDVGLPAKSGIGGGIVTVSPGKGGMGTFAPPLDAAGNSVKGQRVARFLSARLGMDLLISAPD